MPSRYTSLQQKNMSLDMCVISTPGSRLYYFKLVQDSSFQVAVGSGSMTQVVGEMI